MPLVILEGMDKEIKQWTNAVTYQQILSSLDKLKAHGILFGVLTPTKRSNFKLVTSDDFILPLIRKGSRLNWYVTSHHEQEVEQLDKKEIAELEGIFHLFVKPDLMSH